MDGKIYRLSLFLWSRKRTGSCVSGHFDFACLTRNHWYQTTADPKRQVHMYVRILKLRKSHEWWLQKCKTGKTAIIPLPFGFAVLNANMIGFSEQIGVVIRTITKRMLSNPDYSWTTRPKWCIVQLYLYKIFVDQYSQKVIWECCWRSFFWGNYGWGFKYFHNKLWTVEAVFKIVRNMKE